MLERCGKTTTMKHINAIRVAVEAVTRNSIMHGAEIYAFNTISV